MGSMVSEHANVVGINRLELLPSPSHVGILYNMRFIMHQARNSIERLR